ncbi:hypothetical protein BD779DRAFT_1444783 [Infundibulicybe gibba]|nr:hypothetical protein BD779DRAFT_1444783 [Infundibulicybe gibba]
MRDLQKTLVQSLVPQSQPNPNLFTQSATGFGPTRGNCNFCGNPGHYISRCPSVEEYIRNGKVRRNAENRVILSTGAFVPRDVPGATLKDRVDEWHRANSGQLATGQITSNADTTSQMIFAINPYQYSISEANEHIADLERQLLAMQGSRTLMDHVSIMRRPKASKAGPNKVVESGTVSTVDAPAKEKQAPTKVTPRIEEITNDEPNDEPLHPFANAKEASQPALTEQDRLAAEKKGTQKSIAPIEDPQLVNKVYTRVLDSPMVTLTTRELLSVSPAIRSLARSDVTPTRTPQNTVLALNELPFASTDDSNPAIRQGPVPPGAITMPDDFEVYIQAHGTTGHDDVLTVAKESHALRALQLQVDNQGLVEAIIDPGSQIIAMSETICDKLGLRYDRTIQLRMQSANGDVDLSLGLARNVSIRVGGITLYVQVHIIRSPAYDILLGRPFDVLTRSVVRNFENEDQTITIHDPNTGRSVTIKTIPRTTSQRKEDFQSSRI